MLRVAKKRAVLLGVIVLLAACGGESDPEQVTATPPAEAQVPAEPPIPDVPTATPASTQQQAADFAAQAEQALREEHMFAPAGSNAFEWFLRAHELDRENVFARDALFDLIPYAVLHIEQRIAARDRAEVERLIPLLQRAQPEAPALPRLQNALSALSPEASPTAVSARRPEQRPSVAVTPRPAPSGDARKPVTQPSIATRGAQSPPSAGSPPQATPIAAAASAAADVPPRDQAQAKPATAEPSAPVTRTLPITAREVPEPISRAAPRYPVLAERRKIEGTVELEFTIQADGAVANVRVLRSEPEGIFDRDAVAAMQRWRYPPIPTAIKARRSFDFKLGKR
jgi:protein TonB